MSYEHGKDRVVDSLIANLEKLSPDERAASLMLFKNTFDIDVYKLAENVVDTLNRIEKSREYTKSDAEVLKKAGLLPGLERRNFTYIDENAKPTKIPQKKTKEEKQKDYDEHAKKYANFAVSSKVRRAVQKFTNDRATTDAEADVLNELTYENPENKTAAKQLQKKVDSLQKKVDTVQSVIKSTDNLDVKLRKTKVLNRLLKKKKISDKKLQAILDKIKSRAEDTDAAKELPDVPAKYPVHVSYAFSDKGFNNGEFVANVYATDEDGKVIKDTNRSLIIPYIYYLPFKDNLINKYKNNDVDYLVNAPEFEDTNGVIDGIEMFLETGDARATPFVRSASKNNVPFTPEQLKLVRAKEGVGPEHFSGTEPQLIDFNDDEDAWEAAHKKWEETEKEPQLSDFNGDEDAWKAAHKVWRDNLKEHVRALKVLEKSQFDDRYSGLNRFNTAIYYKDTPEAEYLDDEDKKQYALQDVMNFDSAISDWDAYKHGLVWDSDKGEFVKDENPLARERRRTLGRKEVRNQFMNELETDPDFANKLLGMPSDGATYSIKDIADALEKAKRIKYANANYQAAAEAGDEYYKSKAAWYLNHDSNVKNLKSIEYLKDILKDSNDNQLADYIRTSPDLRNKFLDMLEAAQKDSRSILESRRAASYANPDNTVAQEAAEEALESFDNSSTGFSKTLDALRNYLNTGVTTDDTDEKKTSDIDSFRKLYLATANTSIRPKLTAMLKQYSDDKYNKYHAAIVDDTPPDMQEIYKRIARKNKIPQDYRNVGFDLLKQYVNNNATPADFAKLGSSYIEPKSFARAEQFVNAWENILNGANESQFKTTGNVKPGVTRDWYGNKVYEREKLFGIPKDFNAKLKLYSLGVKPDKSVPEGGFNLQLIQNEDLYKKLQEELNNRFIAVDPELADGPSRAMSEEERKAKANVKNAVMSALERKRQDEEMFNSVDETDANSKENRFRIKHAVTKAVNPYYHVGESPSKIWNNKSKSWAYKLMQDDSMKDYTQGLSKNQLALKIRKDYPEGRFEHGSGSFESFKNSLLERMNSLNDTTPKASNERFNKTVATPKETDEIANATDETQKNILSGLLGD